eukprot:COSAG02_NODE_38991_length_422_cov_0.925697_1_plen_37_part_01
MRACVGTVVLGLSVLPSAVAPNTVRAVIENGTPTDHS